MEMLNSGSPKLSFGAEDEAEAESVVILMVQDVCIFVLFSVPGRS